MHQYIINSPVGKLAIVVSEHHVHSLHFLAKNPTTSLISPNTPFIQEVITHLNAYFKNPTHIFDLPIKLSVTSHHHKVLEALKNIPVGKTRTYGEIAKEIGSSPRAVGNACRHNPVALLIPCHRVVGANNIGGFAGDTSGTLINIKKWLLDWESK